MNDFFEIMLPASVTVFLLAGIHAYFGSHVVRRGVIFVDLALAQIAALGATSAIIFGYQLHSTGSYFISLMFALLGALIFAISRSKSGVVEQEAIIGIIYAVSAALTILVLSKAPEGGEELKSLLVGHLLFVDWKEVRYIAVLYGIISVFHWKFREKLTLISENPILAKSSGLNIFLWDFFFYGTFAFVVVSSVEVGGVLLVFALLVIPSVCGLYLAKSSSSRLVLGWSISAIACLIGLVASYFLDLPTGATIVCSFGLVFLMVIFYKLFFSNCELENYEFKQ